MIAVLGFVVLAIGFATTPATAAAPTVTVTAAGDCTQNHSATSFDDIAVTTTASGLNPALTYDTIVGDVATLTLSQHGDVIDGQPDAQGNLSHTGSTNDVFGATWDVGTTYEWILNEESPGAGNILTGTFVLQAGDCGGDTSTPPASTTTSRASTSTVSPTATTITDSCPNFCPSSSGGALANTGSHNGMLTAVGLALLVSGAFTLAMGLRRRGQRV
jgi:LPXTG-motif cell wall-anchored protein